MSEFYQVQQRNDTSSMQSSHVVQNQIEQEFQQGIIEYESGKQKVYTQEQADQAAKLNKMEIILMNETDPELSDVKQDYLAMHEQFLLDQEDKKRRIRKRVEEEMEDKLSRQLDLTKKQQDMSREDEEDKLEKELRKSLLSYQEELSYSHFDIKKKIQMRKKEMEESDSKQMKEFQQQRKNVQLRFEKVKNTMKDEYLRKAGEYEKSISARLKNEKEQFLQRIREYMIPQINEAKGEIDDLEIEYENRVRQIKDSLKWIYAPQIQDLQNQYQNDLNNYQSQQNQTFEQELKDWRSVNYEQVLQNKNEEIRNKKDQLQSDSQAKLNSFKQQRQLDMDQQRNDLQEQKRKRLTNLKQKMMKKSGRSMDEGDKEIEMFIEVDRIRNEIDQAQDRIHQIKKSKDEMNNKQSALNNVYVKYELARELTTIELVRYELEQRRFVIEKLKSDVDKKQNDVLQLLNAIGDLETKKQREQSTQENQQKNQQTQELMQQVSELKDLIQQQIGGNESKVIQRSQLGNRSALIKMSMDREFPKLEMQHSQLPQNNKESQLKELRVWHMRLVQDRVDLNKYKAVAKDEKAKLSELQGKLLRDQAQLKEEVQFSKTQTHKSLKKDILKKMKTQLQSQLMELSKSILNLNESRAILKQKDIALSSIEKTLNQYNPSITEEQSLEQFLQTMNHIYQMYLNIDLDKQDGKAIEELLSESNFEENIEKVHQEAKHRRQDSDSKFRENWDSLMSQQNRLSNMNVERSSPSRQLQTFQPQMPSLKMDKSQTVDHEQRKKLQQQLNDHRDWLQTSKYQLSRNMSRSPESRQRLKAYSNLVMTTMV